MLKELWMTLLLPDSRKLKTFGQVCEFKLAVKDDLRTLFFLARLKDHPDYPNWETTYGVPDPIHSCFPNYKDCLVPCLVFSLLMCHSFCCVYYCDMKFILEKAIRMLSAAPNGIPYWENHTFFSWVPSENQTKAKLLAIHNAHVNSSESIRIFEASTGSQGKPVWQQGAIQGFNFWFMRKWGENCSQSQGVTMKIKYVSFLITLVNHNFVRANWSQSTLMLFRGWVRLSMFAIWFFVSGIVSVFSRYCQQRRRLGWTGQASYPLAFWRITQTKI